MWHVDSVWFLLPRASTYASVEDADVEESGYAYDTLKLTPECISDSNRFSANKLVLTPDYDFHTPGDYYISPTSSLLLPLAEQGPHGEQYQCLLLRKLKGTPFFERIGFLQIYRLTIISIFNALPLSDITLV
jgi:hypothetical protein